MKILDMLRIVAYDIADPRRLRHVAKTCELYGIRIEKSLFECDLSEEIFLDFWKELKTLIDEQEDSVVAYCLNRADVQRIVSLGCCIRPDRENLFFAGP